MDKNKKQTLVKKKTTTTAQHLLFEKLGLKNRDRQTVFIVTMEKINVFKFGTLVETPPKHIHPISQKKKKNQEMI